MAIVDILFKMMKHVNYECSGNLLTFGKQEILLSPEYIKSIKNDLNKKGNAIEMSAEVLLKHLGFDNIDTLEYPGHGESTIEQDLNEPISEIYYNSYDGLLDAGHMEHCFNAPEIMRSIFYFLKPGGQIIHFNPCQGNMNHGFYDFQPTFYFSFYQTCKFKNIKVFLIEGGDPLLDGKYRVIKLSENYNNMDYTPPFCPSTYLLVFATKTEVSEFQYPNIEFYQRIFNEKKKYKGNRIPDKIYQQIVGATSGNSYNNILKDSFIL